MKNRRSGILYRGIDFSQKSIQSLHIVAVLLTFLPAYVSGATYTGEMNLSNTTWYEGYKFLNVNQSQDLVDDLTKQVNCSYANSSYFEDFQVTELLPSINNTVKASFKLMVTGDVDINIVKSVLTTMTSSGTCSSQFSVSSFNLQVFVATQESMTSYSPSPVVTLQPVSSSSQTVPAPETITSSSNLVPSVTIYFTEKPSVADVTSSSMTLATVSQSSSNIAPTLASSSAVFLPLSSSSSSSSLADMSVSLPTVTGTSSSAVKQIQSSATEQSSKGVIPLQSQDSSQIQVMLSSSMDHIGLSSAMDQPNLSSTVTSSHVPDVGEVSSSVSQAVDSSSFQYVTTSSALYLEQSSAQPEVMSSFSSSSAPLPSSSVGTPGILLLPKQSVTSSNIAYFTNLLTPLASYNLTQSMLLSTTSYILNSSSLYLPSLQSSQYSRTNNLNVSSVDFLSLTSKTSVLEYSYLPTRTDSEGPTVSTSSLRQTHLHSTNSQNADQSFIAPQANVMSSKQTDLLSSQEVPESDFVKRISKFHRSSMLYEHLSDLSLVDYSLDVRKSDQIFMFSSSMTNLLDEYPTTATAVLLDSPTDTLKMTDSTVLLHGLNTNDHFEYELIEKVSSALPDSVEITKSSLLTIEPTNTYYPTQLSTNDVATQAYYHPESSRSVYPNLNSKPTSSLPTMHYASIPSEEDDPAYHLDTSYNQHVSTIDISNSMTSTKIIHLQHLSFYIQGSESFVTETKMSNLNSAKVSLYTNEDQIFSKKTDVHLFDKWKTTNIDLRSFSAINSNIFSQSVKSEINELFTSTKFTTSFPVPFTAPSSPVVQVASSQQILESSYALPVSSRSSQKDVTPSSMSSSVSHQLHSTSEFRVVLSSVDSSSITVESSSSEVMEGSSSEVYSSVLETVQSRTPVFSSVGAISSFSALPSLSRDRMFSTDVLPKSSESAAMYSDLSLSSASELLSTGTSYPEVQSSADLMMSSSPTISSLMSSVESISSEKSPSPSYSSTTSRTPSVHISPSESSFRYNTPVVSEEFSLQSTIPVIIPEVMSHPDTSMLSSMHPSSSTSSIIEQPSSSSITYIQGTESISSSTTTPISLQPSSIDTVPSVHTTIVADLMTSSSAPQTPNSSTLTNLPKTDTDIISSSMLSSFTDFTSQSKSRLFFTSMYITQSVMLTSMIDKDSSLVSSVDDVSSVTAYSKYSSLRDSSLESSQLLRTSPYTVEQYVTSVYLPVDSIDASFKFSSSISSGISSESPASTQTFDELTASSINILTQSVDFVTSTAVSSVSALSSFTTSDVGSQDDSFSTNLFKSYSRVVSESAKQMSSFFTPTGTTMELTSVVPTPAVTSLPQVIESSKISSDFVSDSISSSMAYMETSIPVIVSPTMSKSSDIFMESLHTSISSPLESSGASSMSKLPGVLDSSSQALLSSTPFALKSSSEVSSQSEAIASSTLMVTSIMPSVDVGISLLPSLSSSVALSSSVTSEYEPLVSSAMLLPSSSLMSSSMLESTSSSVVVSPIDESSSPVTEPPSSSAVYLSTTINVASVTTLMPTASVTAEMPSSTTPETKSSTAAMSTTEARTTTTMSTTKEPDVASTTTTVVDKTTGKILDKTTQTERTTSTEATTTSQVPTAEVSTSGLVDTQEPISTTVIAMNATSQKSTMMSEVTVVSTTPSPVTTTETVASTEAPSNTTVQPVSSTMADTNGTSEIPLAATTTSQASTATTQGPTEQAEVTTTQVPTDEVNATVEMAKTTFKSPTSTIEISTTSEIPKTSQGLTTQAAVTTEALMSTTEIETTTMAGQTTTTAAAITQQPDTKSTTTYASTTQVVEVTANTTTAEKTTRETSTELVITEEPITTTEAAVTTMLPVNTTEMTSSLQSTTERPTTKEIQTTSPPSTISQEQPTTINITMAVTTTQTAVTSTVKAITTTEEAEVTQVETNKTEATSTSLTTTTPITTQTVEATSTTQISFNATEMQSTEAASTTTEAQTTASATDAPITITSKAPVNITQAQTTINTTQPSTTTSESPVTTPEVMTTQEAVTTTTQFPVTTTTTHAPTNITTPLPVTTPEATTTPTPEVTTTTTTQAPITPPEISTTTAQVPTTTTEMLTSTVPKEEPITSTTQATSTPTQAPTTTTTFAQTTTTTPTPTTTTITTPVRITTPEMTSSTKTQAPTTTTTKAPTTTTTTPVQTQEATTTSTQATTTSTQAPTTTTQAPTTTTQAPTTTTQALTTTTRAPTTNTQAPTTTTQPPATTTQPPTTTTTQATTTTSPTTTEATSTTPKPVVTNIANGRFRITNENWSSTLLEKTSNDYKTLESKILPKLQDTFMTSEYKDTFVDVTITSFSEGSVVTNYKVEFTGDKAVEDTALTSAVQAAVKQGKFGSFDVDSASVNHEVIKSPTTTAPPKDPTLPNWGIAVIVCGSVVLIFLLTMICVLCSRRHTRQKYRMSEDPDDIDYRRSWAGRSEDFAYDNNFSNSDERLNNGDGVKEPVQFYNLTNDDLVDTNILDPVIGMNGKRSSANSASVNGFGRMNFLRLFGDTETLYDENTQSWETKL